MEERFLKVFPTLPVLVRCFRQGNFAKPRFIHAEIVAKTQNGKPAVLPICIVLHELITEKAESDAPGASAAQIEANAPGFYSALAGEVSIRKSSNVPVEINVAAITSTTLPQPKRLNAKGCACRRKVHHA